MDNMTSTLSKIQTSSKRELMLGKCRKKENW